MVAVSGYVHGYETQEQERLVAQAEHWRRLIRDGTQLEPGTRLLEVGCGVGAVLAVPGQEFPGVRLFGVDIEASSSSSRKLTSSEAASRRPCVKRMRRRSVRGRVVRPRPDDVVPRARSRPADGAS
jgi:cyclopropane fatty-acyl-phospholipid synthase-like methyltransferase